MQIHFEKGKYMMADMLVFLGGGGQITSFFCYLHLSTDTKFYMAYPEIVCLIALIVYNSMNWPGGATISFFI